MRDRLIGADRIAADTRPARRYGRRMLARVLLPLVVLFAAAGSAGAEPTPPSKPARARPAAKPEVAPVPAAPAPGSLADMAARAAAGAEARPAPVVSPGALDLTPRRQLEALTSGDRSRDRRGAERTSGIDLGDDSSWKVQAIQVGTMAALFGTLVAVCGDGKCMLPGFFGGGRDDIGLAPGAHPRKEPTVRSGR
jgi:hypothetical protein